MWAWLRRMGLRVKATPIEVKLAVAKRLVEAEKRTERIERAVAEAYRDGR